ncbi:MAG: tetratricopeptide repeat protein [Chloroflexi bacterium]|nr:tetratricopeptide repeat protein [Chloroflexota bacterium]
MYLSRGGFNLRKVRRNNPNRMALYLVLIIAGLYVLNLRKEGVIDPIGVFTPTATRNPVSYSEEAETQFSAGQLDKAVEAYLRAIQLDTKNVEYRIRLARIQVYANKPEDGVKTAGDALLLAPENSTAHAVHALALDWTSEYEAASDAAVRAIQLDPNNALAHAYYAEILTDLQRYAQARDEAREALRLDPNSMDAYRAYGWYLESTSNYEEAIEAYKSAVQINPYLPFLYMQIGVNYRAIFEYDLAVQYFQRASSINPNDIGPYLSISRTYFQTGEYGRASQYLESALEIDPANSAVHGQLGLVYFKSLNYESAILELGCAVDSCAWQEGNVIRVNTDVVKLGCSFLEKGCPESDKPEVQVEGLALDKSSLETYYTYSSVLAALAVPGEGKPYCNRARPLFQQILASFSDDTVVVNIMQENENVCQIADNGGTNPVAAATPALAVTPTP